MPPDDKDPKGNVTNIAEAKKKRERKAPPKPEINQQWESILTVKHGSYLPSLGNATAVLFHHEAWQGVFSHDEQADRVRKIKPIPFHPVGAPSKEARTSPFLTDDDVDGVCNWLERFYGFAVSRETASRAIRVVARRVAYHPIRVYLEGLVWDGVKRLDDWLGFLKVELNLYTRTVGRKWLISAVARAMVPGCQADYMLVVEGEQRSGKSTALASLSPEPAWFLNTKVDLANKDAYQIIASKWLVCFDELDSMSRADDTRSKAFITNRVDSYCKRYSKEPTDQPRASVLVGTTNERVYLKDHTGGGRYWPVWSSGTATDLLDIAGLVAVRDQLWAEAVHYYKEGEPWHLTDPAVIALATAEQAKRLVVEPWDATIGEILRNKGYQREGITTAKVLELLDIPPSRVTKSDEMRAARSLRANGWEMTDRTTSAGKRVRLYRPKDNGIGRPGK